MSSGKWQTQVTQPGHALGIREGASCLWWQCSLSTENVQETVSLICEVKRSHVLSSPFSAPSSLTGSQIHSSAVSLCHGLGCVMAASHVGNTQRPSAGQQGQWSPAPGVPLPASLPLGMRFLAPPVYKQNKTTPSERAKKLPNQQNKARVKTPGKVKCSQSPVKAQPCSQTGIWHCWRFCLDYFQ